MFNIILSFTSVVGAEIIYSNIWNLSPKVYVRNLITNIIVCRLWEGLLVRMDYKGTDSMLPHMNS